MKSRILSITVMVSLLAACTADRGAVSRENPAPEEVAVFTSTDSRLQKAYEWARKTALSYSHDDTDPVGFWYEAALPQREAFCMRDVSHQSVGAQILGLVPHNKNMFSRFVCNISESKDWCGYWEINRHDKPVAADYRNDDEFWYNLNANFDVMQACLKMYRWTGDSDYVSGDSFTSFFDRSVGEYAERWQLSSDKIMEREPYMNIKGDFDSSNHFHTCRGLPSYVENMPGVSVGVDLVASLYAGYDAYSEISRINGRQDLSVNARKEALRYRDIVEEKWWDAGHSRYNTMKFSGNEFKRGEGVPYVLWFGVTENPERIRMALDDILACEWNVENISHFPELFYRYGYYDEGYDFLLNLPAMTRSEYPEVSYGFIEGCVCGVMGFRPDYVSKTVHTGSRLKDPEIDSRIRNIRVFDGYMTVRHVGNDYTEISNDTSLDLLWKASFLGDYRWVEVKGKKYPVEKHTDINGNVYTVAEIELDSNTSHLAKALR
ncbi:MAG: hypothetical protein K2M27_06780 [Muribaculaceae bacterium]|nr:hypothetical protein [Muribaculaceae bacterium]MDE6533221.1 hypothetical protein [Muribaculaceae bacterium]